MADVRANGQREDIVALDGKVLDGRNRYRACLAAGIAPRVVAFHSDLHGEPMAFVMSKNLKRRHMNEISVASWRHGSKPPPRRQPAFGKSRKLLHVLRGEPPSIWACRSRDRCASAAVVAKGDAGGGPGRRTRQAHSVQAAKAVKLAPEQQQRIAAEAEAGRVNAARTVIKQEARQVRERDLGEKIAAGNLALLERRFGVILADPAWGRTVYSRDTGMDRHAANHYATASGDEPTQDDAIKALPVASIAAPDCVLGLWCTDPHRGVDVLRAWGFEPKSYFVWVKDVIAVDGDHDICGMFKSGDRLEIVGAAGHRILAPRSLRIVADRVRGEPVCPAPGKQGESVWFARRGEHAVTREDSHSDKPECAHEWFERHFPNTPKIELGARPGASRMGPRSGRRGARCRIVLLGTLT